MRNCNISPDILYISDILSYGAYEFTHSTARSQAQFEAERFRKVFQSQNESASEEEENMLESALEGPEKHARAEISSAQMPERQ